MFWRYIDFFSLKYNVHVNSIFLKIIDNKKKRSSQRNVYGIIVEFELIF